MLEAEAASPNRLAGTLRRVVIACGCLCLSSSLLPCVDVVVLHP